MVRNKYWMLIAIGMLGMVNGGSRAAQVSPTPSINQNGSGQTTNSNGTLSGSSQKILSAGTSGAGYRVDCTFQNKGANSMYYCFDCTVVSSTTGKELKSGFSLYCGGGTTVDAGDLYVIGTAGDTYVVSEAFVRGQ